MASINQNIFPTVATGVPKNPFATESKLDDIIWFLQKMTGPSLLLFSCIIGIFIVTNKVPETRVKSAEWIFQISMGSGLLAMGVNVTGLLAFAKKTKQQTDILEKGVELISQEQFNPVHPHSINALPSTPISPSQANRQPVVLPGQESIPRMLPGEKTEVSSFTKPPRDSQWIA